LKLFQIRKAPVVLQLKQLTRTDLVLALLQNKGPMTSRELQSLGVSHPGLEIKTLRDLGYTIDTRLVPATNSDGVVRRNMAEYALVTSTSDLEVCGE
jgi:hypothetical protein